MKKRHAKKQDKKQKRNAEVQATINSAIQAAQTSYLNCTSMITEDYVESSAKLENIRKEQTQHYKDILKSFTDAKNAQQEVLDFILDKQENHYQLGRRNLLPAVRIKLAMVAEPIIASKKKENSIANLKQNQTTDTDICRSRTPEKEISSKEKKKIERQNATNYQVAQIAGVSDKSVERYKKIQQKAAPEVVAKVDSGEMSINEGYKQVKQAEKQQRAEEKAERKSFTLEDEMPDDVCKLFQADITKGLPEIADNSIDYIITDPPYPEQYLMLYNDLTILAGRVLKPGGSLICMCGQSYLPRVLSVLASGLTYHWCACYNTPGSAAQIYQRKIMTNWKPLLWLTKGQYKGEWCKDTFTSPANDKRFHHWGQSLGGMEDIVKTITNPNDIILDPFLGGGTTGVAAVINGRKFIGTDIEQSCIDTAMQRIKKAYDYVKRGENGLA